MALDPHPDVAALCAALRVQYPHLRLVDRSSSRFMRLLAVFMGRSFLTEMTTTIGWTVYMPAAVARNGITGVRVLRHEAVHLEQYRRYPVWFPLSYLLLMPAGITMRARWEMEAYIESMRAELDDSGAIADSTLRWIENLFCGPAYLYMDVRRARVRRRLHAAREALLTGSVAGGS